MSAVDCPWCDERTLAWPDPEAAAAPFTCGDCGTTIALVEDTLESFERAA